MAIKKTVAPSKAREWAEKVEALMREANADGVSFDYVEGYSYGGCACCSSGPERLHAIFGQKYLPKSCKPNKAYEEIEVEIP